MKIINSHLHIIEFDGMPDKEKYMGLLKSLPTFEKLEESMALLSMDAVLGQMEDAGISRSVVFACDAPIVYSSNEFVAGICQKWPDKFIGFASVNPMRKNAVDVFENAVKNLGLKGLKLHPPLQDFYPNDKDLWPLYQKADELNLPVVFHVGSTPFGALTKLAQANPILIDDVAIAFPTLKIILTHLGTLWHNETFMIAEKNPNVFVDTAAYPYEIKNLLTKDLINRVGASKFIFGTDFPMPYEGQVHRMKDFVDCIQNLSIPDDMKENVFYKNLEALLGFEL